VKHLFVTQDFTPDRGGMARRHVELCRRWPGDNMMVSTVRASVDAASDAAVADAAEPFEIERVPFTFREANRFTNQMRWAAHLVSLAKDVDLIHCGNVRPVGYAAWWAAKRIGLPYLIYVNGGDLLREREKAKSWLKRRTSCRIFSDSAGVVANSAWTASLASDVMRQVGVKNAPPVAAIDLGTDPTHFRPDRDIGALRAKLDLGDGPICLTVARLVPHKGQDVAIRAIASLAREFPTLRYLLVGEGHDEQRLRDLADDLNVADRVIFVGVLSDDDIAEAYAMASVYVGLSRIDRGVNVEGFGISFVEAGASGTPSVGGDSGGVRAAVRDGITGFVVTPDDVSAAATALRTLLADPAKRKAMGAAARAAVIEHFNWDRVARDTRAFAESVMGKRS
jgi:phosphatidylinositol alpha-1,6-mannosyltransferase